MRNSLPNFARGAGGEARLGSGLRLAVRGCRGVRWVQGFSMSKRIIARTLKLSKYNLFEPVHKDPIPRQMLFGFRSIVDPNYAQTHERDRDWSLLVEVPVNKKSSQRHAHLRPKFAPGPIGLEADPSRRKHSHISRKYWRRCFRRGLKRIVF